ncbi:hypothetical protein [Stenotrophomonas mori]|uniref:Secreted protein n=1 Tax=Stenotrophomonas mori TaxID=2871096 RepID=A0ABT0SK48_9GAMM|nr:hypothetical protein [Stenotrophomonas mori]MCL7715340.1 hypothetical protein [Stenotrophomonas mori]
MRRIAHCLILLLAPLAAHATEALDASVHSGCSYDPGEVERVAVPAASVKLANAAPAARAKHAVPPAEQAGGGSDEEIIPRLRAPKWHRLLPGMFR